MLQKIACKLYYPVLILSWLDPQKSRPLNPNKQWGFLNMVTGLWSTDIVSANCVTGLWTPSSYQGHSVWLRSTPGSVSVSLSSLRGHPQGTVSHSILCPHSLTLNSSVFTGEWEQWRIFLVLFDNFHLVAFLKSISFIIKWLGW